MFEGRVALVTGAASGMGRETAALFAAQGAKVVCADLNQEACDETVEEIRSAGGEARSFILDVSDHDACGEMVRFAVREFGGLHHAFNNAGIRGQVEDIWNETNIRRVLAVNLESVFWCMKHEIAHMVENGGGTIVNTSSTAGVSGAVGAMDYTAAKHGVIGLTKTAALEYASASIRVNAVCPGFIRTAMTASTLETRGDAIAFMTPMGRVGEASEIAEMVVFLCSDRAGFITGSAYQVDGGWTSA